MKQRDKKVHKLRKQRVREDTTNETVLYSDYLSATYLGCGDR